MQIHPFYFSLLLASGLTLNAQESAPTISDSSPLAAVVVEEGDTASPDSDQPSSLSDESTGLTDPTSPAAEPLPQQPDDIQPDTTDASISVNVEKRIQIPQQVELSKNQKKKSKFTLLTPWAPKPMQQAPRGWRYIPASHEMAYPVTVTLANKKKIELQVVPYQLVPEPAKDVIQAREPGYQPSRGYHQTQSISARLKKTTLSLKQASSALNTSIDNLQALVDSLPK